MNSSQDTIDYLNKKIEETKEVLKVYHSSFSEHNEFNKSNTFTKFDFAQYGAFHGAYDTEKQPVGEQIARNRVFVKILEDAMQFHYLSPQDKEEIIQGDRIDLELLEKKTGYKINRLFENPIMIETEVSFNKALELKENRMGQWTPFDIVRAIFDSIEDGIQIEGITEQEIEDYEADKLSFNGVRMFDLDYEDYGGEEYNQQYKEFLFVRDWLESKGYDAVKYINKFEGEGECIMSFRDENIKVTDSYCLKHLLEIKNENNLDLKNKKRIKP